MSTPTPVVRDDPQQAEAILAQAILQDPSMRFVDRALAQGEDWLETEWRVPSDGPLFRGSGEGRVLPGCFTTEHVVQSGELLIWALRGETTPEEGVPVLTRLQQARFKRIVRPGELVRTRVTLTDQLGPAFYVRGKVTVGGEKALEIRLTFGATSAVEGAAAGAAD